MDTGNVVKVEEKKRGPSACRLMAKEHGFFYFEMQRREEIHRSLDI